MGPDGKPIPDDKPKKPRKPREPKDKTAGANGTTATAAASRKKPKAEPKADEKLPADANAQARQPMITEMVRDVSLPSRTRNAFSDFAQLEQTILALSSSLVYPASRKSYP